MVVDVKLRTALDALVQRTTTTLSELDGVFPYVADIATGEWETTPNGNWAGGHWIGLLWIAADVSETDEKRRRFAAAAERHIERMRSFMPTNTPFCGMNFQYAGFRGYDVTGDRALFGLGLTGADAMADMFSEPARQVPIGTESTDFRVATSGEADEFPNPSAESFDRLGAVDNVYIALEVLWRAFEETGDERFRDIAVSHADRHLDWYVRADGSTWNEVEFDPKTGMLERQFNELAHSDETCWARGQGWHIAGLSRAYEETGARRYLDTLDQSVEYYRSRTPDDLVPYWDFEAPGIPDEPRDTSAAVIAAYGLSRLSGDDHRVADLRATGEDILRSLVDSYLVTAADDDRRGMVTGGTFSMPADYGVDCELVWTDYYLAYTAYDLLQRRGVLDGKYC